MTPTPYRIAIPDADLEDLRARLGRTRWPDEVNDEDWSYGTRLDWLKGLVARWREGFDWRAVEVRLNLLPQYRARVDGVDLHFLRVPGVGPAPMPLLLAHGWPGSFVEMERILPLLTDPGAHGGDPADAFEVIVPSLPGFGFSSAPREAGWGPRRMAAAFGALMSGLGHERYAVQGGDWGSLISLWQARLMPERIIGAHVNMFFAEIPGGGGAEEERFRAAMLAWRNSEGAYGMIQGTKPQTLGYAMTDSPAGLAGWIAEKFRTWSDCGGDIASAIDIDALLANISIYWFSGNIASSFRIYKESRAEPLRLAAGERVAVPLGYARFPKEIFDPPRGYIERGFDLRRWTEMPRGGHFAAMEQPGLLAEDIRAFFRPLR